MKAEVALEAVTKQTFNVLLRDIHEILQTEVTFMVMSHNRNVIIITILQASLHFMRAPTSTQMTTLTEAWIITPHLPLPLYYPLSHCLLVLPFLLPSLHMLPTCHQPLMPQHHVDAIIPWIFALDSDRDRDCDRDRDHDGDCLTMAPGHD